MKTKNTQLLDPKENAQYYSQSDGNFMPLEQSLYAHKYLDRIAWARDWVHELDSQNHLDVGCKDGYFCLTLAAEGVDCIGIDPSSDAIEEARMKASEAKVPVTYAQGFAEGLSDQIRADTVSCLEVIEHVLDPEELLKKLATIGRYVMISTPDAKGRHGLIDADRNPEHVRLYTIKELQKLVKKFGQLVECVVRDDQICILFKSSLQ